MKTILEKTTEKFIKDLQMKKMKSILQYSPEEARDLFEKLQSEPVDMPEVKIEEKEIYSSTNKNFSINVVRPKNAIGNLPVILYLHGGGWVMGSFTTHERIVREICVGSQATIVFVNYSLSPESQFPTAIE